MRAYRTLCWTTLLSGVCVTLSACPAPPVECGTGTRLDEARNQCVPTGNSNPGFNRVIDAVDFESFTFSDVNVPDDITTANGATYSYTVTNTTPERIAGLTVRFAIIDQDPETVASYVNDIRGGGEACTEQCDWSNNGVCEDGGAGASAGVCAKGTDCTDCGIRNLESEYTCGYPEGAVTYDPATECNGRSSCNFDDNQSCQCDSACTSYGDCCTDHANSVCGGGGGGGGAPGSVAECGPGFTCMPQTKQCAVNMVTIAYQTITDLPAGEARNFVYEAALPPNFLIDGVDVRSRDYTLVILVGEEWVLMNEAGELVADPLQPVPGPGDFPIKRASGVYVDSAQTKVTVADDALAVTGGVAQASFELDDTPTFDRAPLLANVTVRALGVPASVATITAKLKLPGHTFDVETYDPASPSGVYDQDRSFSMQLGVGEMLVDEGTIESRCTLQGCPDPTNIWKADVGLVDADKVAVPQGDTIDISVPVFLPPAATKILAETLNNRAANPGLTAQDELLGHLLVSVASNRGSGDIEIPVTFMAPEAAKLAEDFDPEEPAEIVPNPNDYAPEGGYAERDNLTPTFYREFGGEWAGAEVQVLNRTSKDRLKQAVIKQEFKADNFARINALKQTANVLKIAGGGDFGTRRPARNNKAYGDIRVLAVPGYTSFDFGESSPLEAVLMSFDFDPTMMSAEELDARCEVTGSAESCLIMDASAFGRALSVIEDLVDELDLPIEDLSVSVTLFQFGIPNTDAEFTVSASLAAEEDEIAVQITPELSVPFNAGPIPLVARVGGALSIGVKGALYFTRDAQGAPEYRTGILARMGPVMQLDGTAFGGASLGPIGIGISGTLTFAKVDVQPTLGVELIQELRNEGTDDACWWLNDGRVTFSAPLNFEAMGGEIAVVASIDIGVGAATVSAQIFKLTLFEWDSPIKRTWNLYRSSTRFGVGAGMCEGAPLPGVEVKTPIGCKTVNGSDAYCPNATGTGAYSKRLYLGPSGNGRITLTGITEAERDLIQLVPGPSFDGEENIYATSVNLAGPDTHVTENPISVSGRMSLSDNTNTAVWFQGFQPVYDVHPLEGWDVSTELRWIDVNFITDGSLSMRGASVRMDTAEGRENTIVTNSAWRGAGGDPGESYVYLDYAGEPFDFIYFDQEHSETYVNDALGLRRRPAAIDDGVLDTASVIFADARRAVFGDGQFHAQEDHTTYFRRAFVSNASSYVGMMRCDDNCIVYVDGDQRAVTTFDDGWKSFRLETLPGVPHMLAVEHRNNGGPGGMIFAVRSDECGRFARNNRLFVGESITSCNGQSKMIHAGNAIYVQDPILGTRQLAAATGEGDHVLVQQDNGDVQLIDANDTVVWSTGTGGFTGARMRLSDRGDVQVFKGDYADVEIWRNGQRCGLFPFDWNLTDDEDLYSCNGDYRMVHHGFNGDVALYHHHTGCLVWNTDRHTEGNVSAQFEMQADGNLALIHDNGTVRWESGTSGNPGGFPYLHNDGRFGLYRQTMTEENGLSAPPRYWEATPVNSCP